MASFYVGDYPIGEIDFGTVTVEYQRIFRKHVLKLLIINTEFFTYGLGVVMCAYVFKYFVLFVGHSKHILSGMSIA